MCVYNKDIQIFTYIMNFVVLCVMHLMNIIHKYYIYFTICTMDKVADKKKILVVIVNNLLYNDKDIKI